MLFYLFIYTLATFGAFAVVVALTRDSQTYGDARRARRALERSSVARARRWRVIMLALLGFPIFGGAGFFAKWYVLQAALQAPVRQTTLAVVLVLTTVVSAGYYLWVVGMGRPVVVELLRDVPSRYRQAVLTNDSTTFLGAGWQQTWELREHFEVIVDSRDIGIRKPDLRAYASASDALQVAPGRILFVDDLTVNVAAAREAGMQAYRFDTTAPAEAVMDLRTLLDLAG